MIQDSSTAVAIHRVTFSMYSVVVCCCPARRAQGNSIKNSGDNYWTRLNHTQTADKFYRYFVYFRNSNTRHAPAAIALLSGKGLPRCCAICSWNPADLRQRASGACMYVIMHACGQHAQRGGDRQTAAKVPRIISCADTQGDAFPTTPSRMNIKAEGERSSDTIFIKIRAHAPCSITKFVELTADVLEIFL